MEWTDRFFRKLNKDYWVFNNIDGFAAHYYCGTAGTATEYAEAEFYRLLEKGLKMEDLVIQQRAALDVWDLSRKIGLIVDEWGTWHPVEKGTNPAFLYQQNTIRDALGDLPIIAEDLGVITPDVQDLRDSFGLPGMKILQFAFQTDPNDPFLPHNYPVNCVAYTGTHDNDTTAGWWHSTWTPR